MDEKAAHARREAERADETRDILSKTVLTIPAPVGSGDRLFGSVTNQDIADAIYAARKIRVDKRNVDLEDPIKTVGTYMVKVEVHSSVEAGRGQGHRGPGGAQGLDARLLGSPPSGERGAHVEMMAGGGAAGGQSGSDYVVPQNLDAEISVLGASMLTPNVIPGVSEIVRPHHFYRQAHQRIFEVIEDLFSRGEPVDPITVCEELANRASSGAGRRASVHPQPGDGRSGGHQRPALR